MNVVVLTKWVPEPEGTPTIGDDGLLVREGADGALDPGDEYGLEAALQLVEAAGDGGLALLTMGPRSRTRRSSAASRWARTRAYGSPTTPSAAPTRWSRPRAGRRDRQPFDLVIGGVESTDGYTGTVPAAIAELLGVPSLTFARGFHLSDDTMTIERQTAAGYDTWYLRSRRS